MSRRFILAMLLFIISKSGVIGESNGNARFFGWDMFKSYFGIAFRFLRNGIAALVGGREEEGGRIKDDDEYRVNYRGYQVIRVYVARKSVADSLAAMSDDFDGIEFWTPPTVGHHSDILVTPDAAPEVKQYLKNKAVIYEVMIDDLQKLIAAENPKMSRSRREMLIGKRGHTMTWTMYHRFSDMIKYMDVLSNSFKNFVEIITIGYSSEGLPLKVIKVSNTYLDLPKKMAIWIDGGMHGREWITSSVVLYIANELVEKHKQYKKLIDGVDWYLMPVANPDGYEYSHLYDRLWKKTRSKSETIKNNLINQILYGSCEGVDLNQNFDFRWGEYGSVDDPCSNGFVGPKPFSEPESKAISHFITDHKNTLKIFITLHSYSQMWLMPSRYAKNKTSDFSVVKEMADVAVNAIRGIFGNNYGVGVSSAYYPFSGCSQEWAKEVARIKYTYHVELRDRAHYGFILPAHQILPTAKETFTAVKSLVTTVMSIRKAG